MIAEETTATVDKLEATWRSTSALLAEATEEQWKAATDLPGWTVQDNLSHLIAVERMMHGLPAPAFILRLLPSIDISTLSLRRGGLTPHKVDFRLHAGMDYREYLTPDERATNAKRLAELIKIENTITSANTTDDQVASFLKNEKIISQATFEEIEPGAMKRGHRANDSDFNQTGFK